MTKILLSIDYDFFSRELIDWDWGHRESSDGAMFEHLAWQIRYAMLDLYKECHPKHAGVLPSDFHHYLEDCGLASSFDRNLIYVERSHKHAYQWANAYEGQYEHIVSFDAHHDVYSSGELHCGNWLAHVLEEQPEIGATVVYPEWRKEEPDVSLKTAAVSREIISRVETTFYDEWYLEDFSPVSVFICQSPVWLPPHHDEDFEAFIYTMTNQYGWGSDAIVTTHDPVQIRRAPSKKEAKAMRKSHDEAFNAYLKERGHQPLPMSQSKSSAEEKP